MAGNTELKETLDQSWQLRKEKRFADAEILLQEALDRSIPGSFEYNMLKANLAEIMVALGRTKEARQAALEVLDKDPRQAVALTAIGAVALEDNSFSEAVENFSRAYSCAPTSFRAGRLARALEMEGNPDRALHVLQEALQKYPRDSYLLKQFNALQKKTAVKNNGSRQLPGQAAPLEISEDDFVPYAEQMRTRLEEMEPGTAVVQLQKLIKVGKRKNNPHLHLLMGDLQRKAGSEENAARSYQRARELDPENMQALSQLLFSYRRLGKIEEAWPLLKLLLYHRPAHYSARSSLMKDAVELGKEKETALFFEELVKKHPRHRELHGMSRKMNQAAENKSAGNNNRGNDREINR